MTLWGFYLRTALNHLRRGEQRALAALLCITFGVMSLVAMSLVAHAVAAANAITAAELFGADLSLNRQVEDFIGPEHAAELEALRASGDLTQVTLVAHSTSLAFRRPDSGELFFVNSGLGIDPAVYPLAGRLLVGLPAGATAADLLRAPGDVLITRDLAHAAGLRVGDPLLVSDLDYGLALTATVRGLLFDTPNHQGSRLYYGVDTAQRLAGHERVLNVAHALTPRAGPLAEQLQAGGWFAYPAELMLQANAQTRELTDLLLKGAGFLGLLVGGIGIASTMQVLLRRRQREIAVWKTLGYRGAQLQALFAAEAALLGLAGSTLGAPLGVVVARGLLGLISNAGTGSWLVPWSFSPWPVITGALAGVATTVLFALWAIVRASAVSPMALLRAEAVPAASLGWARSLTLAFLLALPFTALTSWIMGSLPAAIGILLFALAGLLALGGLLGGLAWAAAHSSLLSPLTSAFPLVRLAQSSLRRRGAGLVFGMIALFTGLVALACAVVVTSSGQREMAARAITVTGPAVSVLAPASEAAAVRQAVQSAGLEAGALSYETAVERIAVVGLERAYLAPVLIGREQPGDVVLSGAPWGSNPTGVYVPQASGPTPGAQLAVTLRNGAVHTLTVVGEYAVDFKTLRPSLGLLLPAGVSQRLAPPDALRLDLDAPPDQAAALTRRLGQALPQATVINQVAYATRFLAAYRNLFVLAVSMSGLALLAGVLLIANAVSLASLDRRYEIGVLKAVGYTRAHLLAALCLEYGLVAAIATGTALVAVQIMLWILGLANELAAGLLVLQPGAAALIALLGVGLILLTVVLATWRPTGASPALVLNDRE